MAQERIDFTQSMVNSGDVMDWSDMHLNGPILDKHSTGGVGDKISLILAPNYCCLWRLCADDFWPGFRPYWRHFR